VANRMGIGKQKGCVMRRLWFVIAVTVLSAVILARPAVAAAPTREDFSFTDTTVLTDICSFPVTVELTLTGTAINFFDRNGNLMRIQAHVVEHDVFTANGKTLRGLPYTFSNAVIFDPETGEIAHLYTTGVASRVPLPGGDFFLTAGRSDFAAHPGASFLLQPDVGAQGNLAGFCAALAA
jgi:hypothetical protein